MSECKYCRMEPNGNIPDDREDIFRLEVMKLFGRSFVLYGSILHSRLGFTDSLGYTSEEIKINFCPMCGRKLIAEKEDIDCKLPKA